jgi:UDP-N-acetylmuramoyl-tripeptide--D-alanyl-D-alanine ligase
MATPIPPNRATFDANAMAQATGGRVVRGTEGRVAVGVTTDSRAVVPGCAFVALHGESHDGHAFLGAAVDAGATLVLAERRRAPSDARADAVEVGDTLDAWGALARAHLESWRTGERAVVAITGSAGKTTTKELCAALLRAIGPCHATTGNLNNRVGLPAVVLGVTKSHRFVVLELGMSVPGEIAALTALAEPDVAVVTNIGLAHAGGVGGTIEDVAREKGAVFEGLRRDGTAVVNVDDPAVVAQASRARVAATAGFGRDPHASWRLVDRAPLGARGSRLTVTRPGGGAAVFDVPIAGEAAAIDFVAALAAAESALGARIADSVVASALAALPPIAGRMHARRLGGGVLVVDDAYNANPASMRAALASLAEMAEGRRIAVLGEMKELGDAAAREHEALGSAVADAGVAVLVSCGGLADATAAVARLRGVRTVLSRDADEASRAVLELVAPGDTVLVKASRSVGAERVVAELVRARGEEA